MSYNENRLQFVHCDTLFATSDDAKAYVVGQLDQIDRPALYAEPMILKYGSATTPNILFAIGSVGDGNISTTNKTFFIDSAQMEADIKELFDNSGASQADITKLQELVSQIITASGLNTDGTYKTYVDDAILKNASSLHMADKLLSEYIQKLEAKQSLTVKNGETLSLDLNKEDSGMSLTGEVILAPNKIINNTIVPNIILHESNGIFTNVDLDYKKDNGVLTFTVNGVDKDLELPLETHIIKGFYDEKIESLVLKLNREVELKDEDNKPFTSDTITIDFGKLINEWDVLGDDSSTPIILTREKVGYEEELHGMKVWQDVLKGDIRIADESQVPDTILKKDATGRYLYVNGVASNIKYWKSGKKITVQEALDSIKTDISQSDGNLIYLKNDGIYAYADLAYSEGTNTLTFKVSNKNGDVVSKNIKLNSIEIFERAFYDSLTEEIVIVYKNAEGTLSELRIPAKDLIEEWRVDNTNTTVTLVRTRVSGGTDILTANVNIASNSSDNILETQGHALYVKGTADNIRFSGTSTVYDEIVKEQNRATSAETTLNAKIDAESSRAINAENVLDGKISNEVNRATSAETVLDNKINVNKQAIDAETTRAKGEEARIEAKIDKVASDSTSASTILNDKIDAEITRAKGEESRIESKVDAETTRATSAETALNTKIESETTRAQHAESLIDTKADNNTNAINAEILRAIAAETAIDNKVSANTKAISDEITRATTVEGNLNSKIDNEITRAQGEEKRIENAFNVYSANSHTVHEQLATSIKTVGDNLAAEITRSTNAEHDLSTRIDAENNRATTEEKRIEGLINNISSNVDILSGTVASNTTKIADVDTRLTAEVKRSIEAEHDLSTRIENEVNRATTVETALEGKVSANTQLVTSESNRAKAVEGLLSASTQANTDAITAEVTRATNVESDLKQAILDVKTDSAFNTQNTGTITLTKTSGGTGGHVLSGEVRVATNVSGNLINADGQALYATVSLDYDEGTNSLKFKASNGTDKTIQLNAGSIIDSITYDQQAEELVISYTDAQGQKQSVRFSVRTWFNQWGVQNDHKGAIILTKTVNTGGTDILSGEVVIATPSDNSNLLENVQGALYVSNSASNIIVSGSLNVQDAISDLSNKLNQEVVDRQDGDSKLQIQIDKLSADSSNYDAAIKKLQENDIAQQTQIDANKQDIIRLDNYNGQQDSRIAAVEAKNAELAQEQVKIKQDIEDIKATDSKQDTEIGQLQQNVADLELKTNISTIETASVRLEYNSTKNSSSLKADAKVSNNSLNLIKIKSDGALPSDNANGLLFDGSIDYGTF
jgi:hypothetical protein